MKIYSERRGYSVFQRSSHITVFTYGYYKVTTYGHVDRSISLTLLSQFIDLSFKFVITIYKFLNDTIRD